MPAPAALAAQRPPEPPRPQASAESAATPAAWPGKAGTAVLLLAHVAGLIDLVALPVWVGAALIGQYHFGPAQAGGMVTAYLLAAVLASLLAGPRFNRLNPRAMATAGYGLATLAFVLLLGTRDVLVMTALHALAGLGAGWGLSFVHGAIGRSAAPHKLFAIVSLGLSLSAIVALGAAQALIPVHGGPALFVGFAGLMAAATLACALGYPVPRASAAAQAADAAPRQPIPPAAWAAVAGLTLMALTQAMVFSFVERIGAERGFGERVLGVLIALGFVNLLPPLLAGLLQRRLPALGVARAGPVLQTALATTIAFSSGFAPWAAASAVFVAVMIFTHIFLFGFLARQDPSGRAVAMTPAMLMSGAALGPLIGGALVASGGHAALGWAAPVVALAALACFQRAARLAART